MSQARQASRKSAKSKIKQKSTPCFLGVLFLLLPQNENLFNDYFWHFLILFDPVDDFQFFACKNIHYYSFNLKKYSYASFLLAFANRFDPVDEFYTQNSQKALQNRHFRAIFIHFIFVSLIVVFFGQKNAQTLVIQGAKSI